MRKKYLSDDDITPAEDMLRHINEEIRLVRLIADLRNSKQKSDALYLETYEEMLKTLLESKEYVIRYIGEII